MFPSDLTPVEAADYLSTLAGSYDMSTHIEVLDNNRNTISTVRAAVLGGQVDCTRVGQRAAERQVEREDDPKASIARVAKGVTLFDPTHSVAIDSSSPADGALFLDRMIRITVGIRGKLRWYENAIFTGPLTKVDREGPVIKLEAHSVEEFGLGAAFTPDSIKGYKRQAFIDLARLMGETDAWMDIPDNDERLSSSIAIARETRYWDELFYVAAGLGRYCFYDGGGRLRTPRWSAVPAVEFRGGDDGLLLSEPQVSYSTEDFKNAWLVKTSTSGGSDIEAVAVLPPAHPLSPQNLGRNGKPRYLMGVESDTDLRTKAKAQARADFLLKNSLLGSSVQFEARPVWHLDPFDWMRATTPEWSMDAPVSEFSLPIVPGAMTVGYQANLVSPNIAKIRGL